ncbi:branched-chain amino acid ABC transporter substrate-binding protein [Allorhizobium pseudoryzae]|uniref:branched-chain amino acid ABC transporter substrate-binding protein n=1 Tax=Allorhizobium pseudoryzae TaxID=379684 RepID=UPI003CFC7878
MLPHSLRFAVPLVSALLAADAAGAAVIGVVAPQQGPYAALGAQIFAGARAAAGDSDQIVAVNETCEQGNGTDVADRLMAANVAVAIGFLCVETAAEALPRLKMDNIPAISVSVRSKILMEDAQRYQWPFFRLAPVDGMEAKKLAEVILTRWQNRPIALVDDGTIYGRELLSAVRQQIETGGIKPVFTDTFRPGQEQQLALVRRLVAAGASHVIVGGDRTDVAVMARDAAQEGAPLTFVGGDVMRAADRPLPLADGTLAVALPPYAELPAATEVTAKLRSQGIEPEGYTLPAYAAVQTARAALSKAPQSLTETLRTLSVETVLGPLRFGADHELAENPFRLQEWRSTAFHIVEPETE